MYKFMYIMWVRVLSTILQTFNAHLGEGGGGGVYTDEAPGYTFEPLITFKE